MDALATRYPIWPCLPLAPNILLWKDIRACAQVANTLFGVGMGVADIQADPA
jgi:hypothetical protein